MGEMLKEQEKADSSPGNQYTGKMDRSHDETGPITLAEVGITKSIECNTFITGILLRGILSLQQVYSTESVD
jgi:hypothetical protein